MDPSCFGDQLPVLPLQCLFLCPPCFIQVQPPPLPPSTQCRWDPGWGMRGQQLLPQELLEQPSTLQIRVKGAFRIKNPNKTGPLNRMGWRLVLIWGVAAALASPCKACASPGRD